MLDYIKNERFKLKIVNSLNSKRKSSHYVGIKR